MPQAANEASTCSTSLCLIHRWLSRLPFVLVKQRERVNFADRHLDLSCQLTDYMTPTTTELWRSPLKNRASESSVPGPWWGVSTYTVPGSLLFSIPDSFLLFLHFLLHQTCSRFPRTVPTRHHRITNFVWRSPRSVVLKVCGPDQQFQYHLGPC